MSATRGSRRLGLLAGAALLVGVAIGLVLRGALPDTDEAGRTRAERGGAVIESSAAAGDTELGEVLDRERAARIALEARVTRLAERVRALQEAANTDARTNASSVDASGPSDPSEASGLAARDRTTSGVDAAATATEARTARLVRAGFDPAEAESIVAREAALQLEVLEARYAMAQRGEEPDLALFRRDQTILREELGDDAYERYRQATGRTTSARVLEVMDGSAAARAGLQSGDEIVGYDGQRIFEMAELARASFGAEAGREVSLTVRRGEEELRVFVPAGPLGIRGR